MIGVAPARIRPQNRVETKSDKRPSAQTQTYTAPIGGLVTNTPLAASDTQTALVLENFWPTTTGIEPRGGTKLRCIIPGAVRAMFEYRSGGNGVYFVADDSSIYAFNDNTENYAILPPVVTGQSNADYSVLETQTDGGSFLVVVNGTDPAQLFDGTTWQQVTAVSAPFAITNVDTANLSHIWSHRNRTFFIEKGTMNAWYLGVNSIAGAATKLPLAGVFSKGGSLLFGATWSSDSGAGMDDRCVFATDQGEFAVYSGGNPGDTADWSLNGVYDIGEPLGKNAHMSVGGDVIVATKAALVPISAAARKDPSQLKLEAISRPIDPDWRREAVLAGSAGSWQLVKWASRNMAAIIPVQTHDQPKFCWVVNLETGAWSKFTGWTIGAAGVLGDLLYYGDNNGDVLQCDSGGLDNGEPFVMRACYSFDHLGAPGYLKTASVIKGTWRLRTPFEVKHSVAGDYRAEFGAAPTAAFSGGVVQAQWDISNWDEDGWVSEASLSSGAVGADQSLWDVAEWDVADWASDDDSYAIKEVWGSTPAHGQTLAPMVQVISAQSYKLDCELIAIDLVFSTGAPVTS